jgi:uncharacterized protein
MKHRLLGPCFLLFLLAGASAAQEKSHFLIRIEPVRATFTDDATPEEAKVMGEHFQYLKQLLADGKLVMAGPAETGECPFGLVVLEVSDQAAAEEIMKNDPSVKAKIMRGNVYPFTLSLMKGRD